MPPVFDWITSLKPSDSSSLLRDNHLLRAFPRPGFRLKFLNRAGEVQLAQETSTFVDCAPLSRPSIRQLLLSMTSDIGVVSNSDVFPIIKDIDFFSASEFASCIWIGKRLDIQAIEYLNGLSESQALSLTRQVGFKQSPCTVDLFVINKGARDLLLQEKWLDDYCLGSPGVDMRIVEFACSLGIARRYDRAITVLHPNHEPYRVNFRTNIVIDSEANGRFSDDRAKAFRERACSINVALLPPFLQKVSVLRYAVTMYDLRMNRIKNLFQYVTSAWSRAFINLCRSNRIPCQMVTVGNVMLPVPARYGDYNMSLRDLSLRHIAAIRRKLIER